jgi:hypothetical protein
VLSGAKEYERSPHEAKNCMLLQLNTTSRAPRGGPARRPDETGKSELRLRCVAGVAGRRGSGGVAAGKTDTGAAKEIPQKFRNPSPSFDDSWQRDYLNDERVVVDGGASAT